MVDDEHKPLRPTLLRLGIWIVVGGLAIYLIVNGALGIMAKGG